MTPFPAAAHRIRQPSAAIPPRDGNFASAVKALTGSSRIAQPCPSASSSATPGRRFSIPSTRAASSVAGRESTSPGAAICASLPDSSTPSRSPNAAASRRSCVTSTAAAPDAASAFARSGSSAARDAASSEENGSSSSSRRGSTANARASATRCASPPESVAGFRSASAPTPKRASHSPAVARASAGRAPRNRKPSAALSSTLPRKSAGCCSTMAEVRRNRAPEPGATSSPESAIAPASGSAISAAACSSVVFPAPFGPTMATRSPGAIAR